MLAPCWAHVTLMLTHFPHLTKFCRSSKTMEKHSILEQKRGPPPPRFPYETLYETLLGLSWAFVARISTYVGSMLAPYNAILVHKTLCQTHVGPMLGPSWAHTTLYWGYLGPMLAPCYAHVGPFSSTYKFLTLFKNHGKTQYSRAKKPPPQAKALPMAKP